MFFLAHAVRAQRSDGHQNVLWSISYSHIVREQVKSKKPGVFPKPKQNLSKHKHKPKNTQQRKTPRKLSEVKHYAFRKIKSSERLVPLHDDIAIPSSRKYPKLLQVGGSGGSASSQLLNKGDKLVHPRPGR